MSAALTTTEQVPLTAGYTADGAPPANDNFTWAIDGSGAATLDNTSGETINLIAQTAGTGTVTLTDSAGLAQATLDYTVTQATATGLTITVGTPVAKAA